MDKFRQMDHTLARVVRIELEACFKESGSELSTRQFDQIVLKVREADTYHWLSLHDAHSVVQMLICGETKHLVVRAVTGEWRAATSS